MAALSKREKYIAFGVGAAFGIYILNSLVLVPYEAALGKVRLDTDAALKVQNEANAVLAGKRKLRTMIDEMKVNGLLADASQAESQALNALNDWARDTRVTISTVNPERAMTEGAFQSLNYHVTAAGTTSAISRLLYSIESSSLPVRVSEVSLKSVREQEDNLQLQMNFSTLCITGELDKKPKSGSGNSGQSAAANSGGGTP